MGYTTLTEFRIMAGSPIIANRPRYNGPKPAMLPENLATLKRLEASDRRSVAHQCSVHFIAGCDCGADVTDRTPEPVVKAKPARKPAAPRAARPARPARPARKPKPAPVVKPVLGSDDSIRVTTVRKVDTRTVSVRRVTAPGRAPMSKARLYAFSDGPRPSDLR